MKAPRGVRGMSLEAKCRVVGLGVLLLAVWPAVLAVQGMAGAEDPLGPGEPWHRGNTGADTVGDWLFVTARNEMKVLTLEGQEIARFEYDGPQIAFGTAHISEDGRILVGDGLRNVDGSMTPVTPRPAGAPMGLTDRVAWYADNQTWTGVNLHDGSMVTWNTSAEVALGDAAGHRTVAVMRMTNDTTEVVLLHDDGTTVPLPGAKGWTAPGIVTGFSSMAWTGDHYVGLDDGGVAAWDEDGQRLWRVPVNGFPLGMHANNGGWAAYTVEDDGERVLTGTFRIVQGTPGGEVHRVTQSSRMVLEALGTSYLPAGDAIVAVSPTGIHRHHPGSGPTVANLWTPVAAMVLLAVLVMVVGPRVVRARAGGGRKRCLHCGRRRATDLDFCPDCGWRTDDEEREANPKKAPWEHDW